MSTDKTLDQILDEMSQRAEKATEGSWVKNTNVITDAQSVVVAAVYERATPGMQSANGDFIAHARTDVPALIAALKRAIEQREKYASRCHADEGEEALDNAELAEILKGKV